MAVQQLLTCFSFQRSQRSTLTFSDPAKINIVGDVLSLKVEKYDRATGAPLYYADTDLTATTKLANPQALRTWLSFGLLPTTSQQPAGTTVQLKVNDGTDDRYWDGGSWAVAGAGDWNTEADVASNIGTFPATSKQLALVINLQASADLRSTPTLKTADLFWEGTVNYLESIAEALIDSIKTSIRPLIEFGVRHTGGTTFSLNDFETPYNVVSVDAAYDHDTDPGHVTDILSAYDPTARIVTLTGSLPQGTRLWIEFTVEPEVYLNWSSQDYTEVEKVPAVVIDSIDTEGTETTGQIDVKNPSTSIAHVRRFPFRLNLTAGLRLVAESNQTLLKMQDEALVYGATTQLLPWAAVDKQITMRMSDKGLLRGKPSLSDAHEASFELTLSDIYVWLHPTEVNPLVQQFNATLVAPGLQGGAKWTGTKTGQPC